MELWNVKRVYLLCIKLFSFFILFSLLIGVVAGNPFLRPGSNRQPPPAIFEPLPPKTKIDPAFAKDVEFKGYFLLKGIPRFCIFNKKSKYGEWIKLSEQTYEEYEAQSFNVDTETLTMSFKGQSFDLELLNATNSENPSASPSNFNKNTAKQNVFSNSTPIKSEPKVMPPKPKNVPQLPPWLTERMNSPIQGSSQNSGITSIMGSSKSSTRSARSPAFVGNTKPNASTADIYKPPPRVQTDVLASPTSIDSGTLNTPNSATSGGAQVSNIGQNTSSQTTINNSNDLEIESLPPPPPPPNILPPTGPPNLIPSRGD